MEPVNKGLPSGPDRAATHSDRSMPESLVAGSESESAAESVTAKAKETTAAATQQAKALMQDGARQLRAQANGIVDQAATDVGLQLNETVTAVKNSLGPLRDRQPKLASLADHSIDKLQQAAADIEQQDLESVVSSAGELARQRPELFIGGALVVGLALGRFIQLAVEQE